MNMLSYDIIGDIHGHADTLEKLLIKLGYHYVDGVYRHDSRQVIFLGDFVDRGPKIRETLHLVKNMVDGGSALTVMGNHEYNSIGFWTVGPDNNYLRWHLPPRVKQQQETAQQFSYFPDEWNMFLEWFKTIPLFLEKEGARFVHACWDDDQINEIRKVWHGKLDKQTLIHAHDKFHPMNGVIEDVLKGKEFKLPDGVMLHDKDGHSRRHARIKWWKNPKGLHYSDYLFGVADNLKIQWEFEPSEGYPPDAPPVFFGHYWLRGEKPELQSHNVACLDYSVARDGLLCAYRWDGEQRLREDKFVFVSC